MDFTGKTIVITGASSGIGKKLKQFFEKQNTVVSLSRSAEYPDIKCDLSSNDDIVAAAEEIKRRFSKVDVLINNAGYGFFRCPSAPCIAPRRRVCPCSATAWVWSLGRTA